MDFVRMLQAEWAVISQAPFVAALLFFCGFGMAWVLIRVIYGQHIETQKSTIKLVEAERDTLKRQVSDRAQSPRGDEDIQEFRPYDKTWDKVDGFFLWQAAWLWVGEEPRLPVSEKTRAYPKFSMLKQAVLAGDLPYRPERPNAPANAWALVSKSDLRILAAAKRESPSFLLDYEAGQLPNRTRRSDLANAHIRQTLIDQLKRLCNEYSTADVLYAAVTHRPLADRIVDVFRLAGWRVEFSNIHLEYSVPDYFSGIEVSGINSHIVGAVVDALREAGLVDVQQTTLQQNVRPDQPKYKYAMNRVRLRIGHEVPG